MPDDATPRPQPDLTALLGSRICHDLISPLGAIGNGVELLAMSGTAPGPELQLITDAVSSANARIRFFRVAFGAAGAGQRIGRSEVLSILDDMTRGTRLRIDWQAPGDPTRGEAKLSFLALQCLETAMPYGGQIAVTADAGGWRVAGTADKLKLDTALWRSLSGEGDAEIEPAQVHFALLPQEAARLDRNLTAETGDTSVILAF